MLQMQEKSALPMNELQWRKGIDAEKSLTMCEALLHIFLCIILRLCREHFRINAVFYVYKLLVSSVFLDYSI